MILADLVVPTPGIHVVAWIAIVAGISWFITFAMIVRSDLKESATPKSGGYRAVCFLCLMVCVLLSLIVDLGVVLSGTD